MTDKKRDESVPLFANDRRTFLKAAAGGILASALGRWEPLARAGEKADSATSGTAATAGAPFDVRPAEEVVGRLLSAEQAQQVHFIATPRTSDKDVFRIAAKKGRLVIEGSNTSSLLVGFNWYLNYVANVHISWCGDSLNRLPGKLPLPPEEIVRQSRAQHRFALNDIDEAYTGAYRRWDEWEREIDVLALHGYNEIFMPVGAEAVYYDTFKAFGYSGEELRKWIPQPARLTFFLLQCMSQSPDPPSEQLIYKRAELGRKIADRMHALGITPVLSGYFGTVPPEFVERTATKLPDARIIPQGQWAGRELRPDWIDPTTKAFAAVAESFYANSDRLLGPSSMYKMDFLHEGGKSGDVNVGDASRAVETALQKAHPGAIWSIIGWRENPRVETLKAITPELMLVVDGLSDRATAAQRDQQAQFGNVPWSFGTIWNFGGHEKMGANLAYWNDSYREWQSRPSNSLKGIALLPESSDNNPVALAFFSEMPWQDGRQDLDKWFTEWAWRRYGGEDPNAAKAWKALLHSAYSMPPCDTDPPVKGRNCWQQAHDGLFEAQPNLELNKAYVHGPHYVRYDLDKFAEALPALLEVKPELRQSSAYRYDLMDVARQVLSNESRVLLPVIAGAYKGGNDEEFEKMTALWLEYIDLMDRVVATNPKTLLASWIQEARSWADSEEEADQLAWDNLTLITSWWWSKPPALTDYAHREWAGLTGGYYRARWEKYFDSLRRARKAGTAPEAIDWTEFGYSWVRDHLSGKTLTAEPTGDVVALAQQVVQAYRTAPYRQT